MSSKIFRCINSSFLHLVGSEMTGVGPGQSGAPASHNKEFWFYPQWVLGPGME